MHPCPAYRRSNSAASFLPMATAENELEDISFTVQRGETVGIIGTTGAGENDR